MSIPSGKPWEQSHTELLAALLLLAPAGLWSVPVGPTQPCSLFIFVSDVILFWTLGLQAREDQGLLIPNDPEVCVLSLTNCSIEVQ